VKHIEGQIKYLEQEGMPTDIECERAILGAILLDNKTFYQTATISADDFSLDSHRKIFAHMCSLSDAGKAIDYVTLSDELGHRDVAAVGGVVYLTSLTDGLPRVKNIEQYVQIVRDKSRSRKLLMVCQSVAAQVREQEPVDAALSELQDQIIRIVHHGRIGTSPAISGVAMEFLNELQAIRELEGESVGLSTGLVDLDTMTTGFRDSEFYIVGARPGQGKTAFMCQSIRTNCKAGRMCSVFSVEVKRTQIMARLVAMESGISVFDLRDPRALDQHDLNRIALAASEIAKWPLLLEDSPRMDIKQLQAIARLHISQGAEIVYVDFLQKLRAPGKDRFHQVTAIADGLWELGRSTNRPVVALSQLKRKQNPNEEPIMDDLRESGEIEQNANAVFLLYRPLEKDENGKAHYTGLDKIIIAKQRSGPADKFVPVQFMGAEGMFVKRFVSARG
jgi:replicative DNA helicase